MPAGKRNPIKRFRKPPPSIEVDAEAGDFEELKPRLKSARLLRDAFIREYIKDFNGAQALLRLGYKWKQPQIRASEWMKESYTQWKLSQVLDTLEEKAIVTRNEILMGLKREAMDQRLNSGSERISALRSLAKILGMEITKVEGNMTIGGGVMAIPLAGSLEDWEAASKLAQEKLKQEVRK